MSTLPYGQAQEQLDLHDWMSEGSGSPYQSYVSEDERKKRKDAGECELCGTRREMSRHGLLDCPNHPSKPGEYV